jgi:hypothetical protein
MKNKLYIILRVILLISFIMNSPIFAQSEGITIKPYGFFKLDLAYDNARTNNGNFVNWVNFVPDGGKKDGEFNLTSRQTRLGAKFFAGEHDGKTVSAQVETDFYKGPDENKNYLMLRQAFLKIEGENYFILAGQAYDIMAPLSPTTLNYTVLWNCGNPGYRRPMLQVGNKVSSGIEVVGALSRNIAGDTDGDGVDDGEDNIFPTIQGRLAYKVSGKLNMGISGHYGRMEVGPDDDKDYYNSFSVVAFWQVKFTDKVELKGEAFAGKTLSQYLSGIGQGYNAMLEKEISSKGGWLNLVVKNEQNVSFSFGGGVDDPDSDDLNLGDRNLNTCIFGNIFFPVAVSTNFAVELSHWRTGYFNGDDSDFTSNFRIHSGFIFNF